MLDEKELLSSRVKSLRERRGWTIAETARRAGLSVSMLWKVENGQTTLTYGRLARLATGLEVPIGELFANPVPPMRKGGRRVVDRRGSGPMVDVRDNLHQFLATDLARKHNFPCLVDVRADGDGADAEAHGGEEFSFILEGRVRFMCEGYEPVVLEPGDSVYFDASLKHRYLRDGDLPARMLCIYSHPEHARLSAAAEVEPHSLAMRVFSVPRKAHR
jgi:transcriptional regulator with XRE-family HTH domain/quercetin dioxygenase-like cupin family protein